MALISINTVILLLPLQWQDPSLSLELAAGICTGNQPSRHSSVALRLAWQYLPIPHATIGVQAVACCMTVALCDDLYRYRTAASCSFAPSVARYCTTFDFARKRRTERTKALRGNCKPITFARHRKLSTISNNSFSRSSCTEKPIKY